MLRSQLLTAGAGIATALVLGAAAGTTAALAQQYVSDADVWLVRGRVVGLAYQLQGLEADYGGNRAAAISSLETAEASLNLALAIRGTNQQLSDAVIRAGITELADLISRLAGDRADYGGNREIALHALQAAQASLQAAAGTA